VLAAEAVLLGAGHSSGPLLRVPGVGGEPMPSVGSVACVVVDRKEEARCVVALRRLRGADDDEGGDDGDGVDGDRGRRLLLRRSFSRR
jgi:hypothetical protein